MTFSEPTSPQNKNPEREPEYETTIRGMPASMYAGYLKDIPMFLTRRQRELVKIWLTKGGEDPHIGAAKNPPFDMGSFCWWDRFDNESAFEICRQILCWSPHPGDAVVIGEVCLIRQKGLQWLAFNKDFRLGPVTLPPEEVNFEEGRQIIERIVGQIKTLSLLDN